MFNTSILKYFGAILAAQGMAASISIPRDGVSHNAALTRRECYASETAALHCYTEGEDVPQDVELADVQFVADYLRAYGKQLRDGRREFHPLPIPHTPATSLHFLVYTMKAADAAGCAEWLLYSHGTAAAYAKKVDLTYDSSVLFEEIANTIDGGKTTTAENLLSCDYAGGSLGVKTNATAKAYTSKSYVANGYKPAGLLIKVVAA